MTLLEELKSVVEDVLAARLAPSLPRAEVGVAAAFLESFLASPDGRAIPSWVVERFDERWLHGARIADVEWALERGARQRWPRADEAELRQMVELATELVLEKDLRQSWDGKETYARLASSSSPRDLLLRSLALRVAAPTSNAAASPLRYVMRLGFASTRGVTSAGRIFIALPAPEAVRWIIAHEVSSAGGPSDELLCTRERAVLLLGSSEHRWFSYGFRPHASRFRDLDLLIDLEDAGDDYACRATPLGLQVAEELEREPWPSIYAAAAALRADEVGAALSNSGAPMGGVVADIAEQAMARQTRGMVHELRNKLHPLQTALSVLSARSSPSPNEVTAVELATAAISDLFRYVDDVANLTNALRAPDELFRLGPAVRDGVVQGRNGDRSSNIQIDPALDTVDIRAPRAELVQAFANLVRNAIQNKAGPVRVVIGAERSPRGLAVLIDDDGPGVPAELRERIFEAGFSTRPGGTGVGLAMVRDLVRRNLGGDTDCSVAPIGGARLRMQIPNDRVSFVKHDPGGSP